MNFNVDDPLADLLSDNSLDNDNFFDNPTGGGRKTIKSGKSKSKVEDLFGIQEETETDVQSPSTPSQKKPKPIATSTPRIVKQQPSLAQDDDGENDDLGFDPKRPKSNAKKNLFDDLLGTAEPKKNIFDDILSGASDGAKRPATAATKPTISRQSTDTTTDNSNVASQARPKTSTGRRSSAQSGNINADPLGIFGRERETNATASGMSTPVSKKRGTTADWLGLGVESAVTVAPTVAEAERPATPRTSQHLKHSEASATVIKDAAEILHIPDSDEAEADVDVDPPVATNSTAQNILLLNSINLEGNNTFTTLKQQQSQLAIAAQLKSQERALLEMQRRQEMLLNQQDRKFQALVNQQIHRQQQMEENIKMQQQRINTHIQLLMMQPPIVGSVGTEADDTLTRTVDETLKPAQKENELRTAVTKDEQMLQLENELKRNELEKVRLEELVANMKVNHEQEIMIIENSYKKQLNILDEHQVAMEERIKTEKQYFVQKQVDMELEIQKLKNDNDAAMSALKQDHEDDVRRLRQSQEVDIEAIKEEHRRMLDAIRQSKMLEFAAVQENGNYLESMRAASNNLETLTDGLQGLRDVMSSKLESLHKERERKLDARERLIEDTERRLKLNEERADEEKRRLMELVSTLELQLNRLSKDTAEENWQLRQRLSSLDAEKQAFEREKEFHREQMARDEKRLEELKTLQLAEAERMQLEMQKDLQSRLRAQSNLDKDRLQLEAQIQATQEAVQRADEERIRYHKQQRELDQRKRLLLDKETALNAKEDDLAQSSSAYRIAIGRAHMAEHKAREAEQLLQEKLQLFSKRTQALSEKEAQLSQERMLLSQDRIEMHALKQQIAQGKCSLCRMGAENAEYALRMGGKAMSEVCQKTGKAVDNLILPLGNIVDRMLDDNIESSYRRMYNLPDSTEHQYWPTAALDDDAKKLVLDNNNGVPALDLEYELLTHTN